MTRKSNKTQALRALLLCTAASFVILQDGIQQVAFAQQAEQRLDIPTQELGTALTRLADTLGLRLVVATDVIAGKRSTALSGVYSANGAFAQLLAGTGVSYSFPNNGTVRITGPAIDEASFDGLLLDPITISGGSGEEAIYETPGAVAHISQTDIDRFRGSSPGDIFRGTPGVISGEARNGSGAIDVNIRGMQGMGRVATTIDGAENSMQVYQGYQGISNRTFMDPDLLGGVDISKGSDVTSGGIAGTVAMRTLSADDIVKDGNVFGLRLKGGFGTNTSAPNAGDRAGYRFRNILRGTGTATASETGMERPGLLDRTQGSGSVVAAMKTENVDLLAGYAYRKRGNYHAGENGPAASPEWIGGYGTDQGLYYDYVQNSGVANYRAGEEVLNSELETKSFIAKGTLRFGNGHAVELSHSSFDSEAGDFLARTLTSNTSQATQSDETSGTRLSTQTLKYRWDPIDNDLIDLKFNLWNTNLETLNPPRWGVVDPVDLGLPAGYRVGSQTTMWGLSLDNRSVFDIGSGSFDLSYGFAHKNEDVHERPYTSEIENVAFRNAEREETSIYAKLAYSPLDWLTVNGGLRYSHFKTRDRNLSYSAVLEGREDTAYNAALSDSGFSPSIGATFEPWADTQFYVNYSQAKRMPSLVETSASFVSVNPAITPEHARNWEIGTNITRDGVFNSDDTSMLKFGFFDWKVDDYLSREWKAGEEGETSTLQVFNIDRAHFQGLELSYRYMLGGFSAELAANYYTKVEFCRTDTTCENKSLYADYATNQVPPEYSVDLTVSQKFRNDALTVGGRISYTGGRAIGHGDATGQGMSEFITQVNWEPYTLVDVFAEYEINDAFTASVRVENLLDQFYVDPISIVAMPGPGRTIYASLTAEF